MTTHVRVRRLGISSSMRKRNTYLRDTQHKEEEERASGRDGASPPNHHNFGPHAKTKERTRQATKLRAHCVVMGVTIF